jgi:hypothetical protein
MGEQMIGDLQDGMLSYYLEQAKASDVNVEKRIDSEPFDYHELIARARESERSSYIHDFPIRNAPCQIFPPLSIIAPSLSIEKEPNSR